MDVEITDQVVEAACAAYWWEDSLQILTWEDLVNKDDHRLPRWREKMRAALEAVLPQLKGEGLGAPPRKENANVEKE